MAYEFPRNLRYSPVNALIVNWGLNGKAFNDCGLPDPIPCEDDDETGTSPPCCPLPIKEAIDTMGWEAWLPEVIVGVEDPDKEIAASYVREAAIQFAKYTRTLQRQVLIPLQPDICTYPVEPYDQEQIIGIIGAGMDDKPACECNTKCTGYVPEGVRYTLDVARNEIHIEGCPYDGCNKCNTLRLLVWSAPTEDACDHDVFLYERFRQDITAGARWNYVSQVHFRDAQLVQSLRLLPNFQERMAFAKNKALSRPSSTRQVTSAGMWGRGAF